ncbi:hypothetical protein [Sphingobium bisphenolivorans]|uniref:hypothetical protein n=1 Tax=Sphingobium bisphenolivorans TaxID=1335760 RepID=UPI00039B7481|nr:hypothetical protein [Sphingobium bisphenolivorans]
MQDLAYTLIVATAALSALLIVATAALRGWNGWLGFKHAELGRPGEGGQPSAVARIEVADLRERVRKLEAIAAGVDL